MYCTGEQKFFDDYDFAISHGLCAHPKSIGHLVNIGNTPGASMRFITSEQYGTALFLDNDEVISDPVVLSQTFRDMGAWRIADDIEVGKNVFWSSQYPDIRTMIRFMEHDQKHSMYVFHKIIGYMLNALVVLLVVSIFSFLHPALGFMPVWWKFLIALVATLLLSDVDKCELKHDVIPKNIFDNQASISGFEGSIIKQKLGGNNV